MLSLFRQGKAASLNAFRVKRCCISDFNVAWNPTEAISMATTLFKEKPKLLDREMDKQPHWLRSCGFDASQQICGSSKKYPAIVLGTKYWSRPWFDATMSSLTLVAPFNSEAADLMGRELRQRIDGKFQMKQKISTTEVMEIIAGNNCLFAPMSHQDSSGHHLKLFLASPLFVEYARVNNLQNCGFPPPDRFHEFYSHGGHPRPYRRCDKVSCTIEALCNPVQLIEVSREKPNTLVFKKAYQQASEQIVTKVLPSMGVKLPSSFQRSFLG